MDKLNDIDQDFRTKIWKNNLEFIWIFVKSNTSNF